MHVCTCTRHARDELVIDWSYATTIMPSASLGAKAATKSKCDHFNLPASLLSWYRCPRETWLFACSRLPPCLWYAFAPLRVCLRPFAAVWLWLVHRVPAPPAWSFLPHAGTRAVAPQTDRRSQRQRHGHQRAVTSRAPPGSAPSPPSRSDVLRRRARASERDGVGHVLATAVHPGAAHHAALAGGAYSQRGRAGCRR